jgi:hypothetical protein
MNENKDLRTPAIQFDVDNEPVEQPFPTTMA